MKKLLLKIKFYHKYDVGEFLIQRLSLILQTLPNFLQQKNIIISFIPSHWRRRYLEKGYNQSELLAKDLANQLFFPMIPVAKKKKYTASQVKLNKQERQKNLNNAFILLDLQEIPFNATILLVDDILTTGATLNTLAKTIKNRRPDLTVRGTVLARNMR